ncbi:mannosylglycerate hydrolase [Shouchella shacheensis]|uniref:mannosylglycerate hydrolase n=1 Tax=Shouchella shacheensis TaxID=1649580 RepID=UPI0007401D6D|nr:mannosylglycerate hydrolase [Shouchella shacheensis]
MKNVHVVPHMHWDREWYFSTEESRILLVNNMEEIMEMLETNPNYPYYVLDGQTSILEDYFAVKPENKERVKKLVQEGRLIIGPWYTQTDEMVVAGESIARNLLYGIKDTKAFGDYMPIGYLPDSFGQSAQMPQILQGFEIDYAMFWRGTSERMGTDKTEFHWESDDGSRVLTQLLPLGYAIGKYLPEEVEALKKRMSKYMPVLDRGATSEHILLPNGHDQMPIQKNIFTILEQLKKIYPNRHFFLSRYEHLFAEIEKNKELPTLKGEFLDGKYMRVHRSIYSTRMDIKAANARIENKLTNILEPLASMAYKLGFEYHHGLIELIWKEMMKNHAHDSIGCCCSDKVHREICGRFFLAEEKTDQLIEFYKRKIVDAIETEKTEDRFTLFNLLPYEREEVVTTTIISKLPSFTLVDETENELDFELMKAEEIDPGLIDRQIVHYGNYDPFIKYTIQLKDRLPALGYKTYFVTESDEELNNETTSVDQVDTDFFTLNVAENGTLTIHDKKNNRTYNDVLVLEDGGDDGDEYDFSPLADETLIFSDTVQTNTTITENRHAAHVHIQYKLALPEDLKERQAEGTNGFVDVTIELTVPKHKPVIDVRFTLNNQAKDHRLRAYIPTDIASSFSISDNQFGTIKRGVYDEAMDIWEEEGWSERPDSIYPMMSFVGLSNNEHGVAVLSNSTREYEIVGDEYDTIAVTLFRSVGVLGKEEMLRRPGRPSGIKLPTPDSQLLGEIHIDLAIATHSGDTRSANVARVAKEYLTPVVSYNKIPHNAMKLNPEAVHTPATFSLLHERSPEAVLSTLKKAENEEKLVLRFYNAMEADKDMKFQLGEVEGAQIANLNEKPLETAAVENGSVKLHVKMNQVKSLMF